MAEKVEVRVWDEPHAIGRGLVPIVFIVAGLQKLYDIGGVARTIASIEMLHHNLFKFMGPMGFAYLVAVIGVVCGSLILIGAWTRFAALVLVIYTAIVTFTLHNFWDMEGVARDVNQIHFLKNLSIMGALLMIFSAGGGFYAVDRG